MALSGKRMKELKKLRSGAAELWQDQKEVLEQASKVVRDATHNAAEFGREDVAPKLREALNEVRPGVASASEAAREKLATDVLPAVSSALSSALAVLDVAKDPQVRKAIAKAVKTGSRRGPKVGATPPRTGAGPGTYILIGLGLVAAAGIAYAAWQTFRADDELWVSDEADDEPLVPASPES